MYLVGCIMTSSAVLSSDMGDTVLLRCVLVSCFLQKKKKSLLDLFAPDSCSGKWREKILYGL